MRRFRFCTFAVLLILFVPIARGGGFTSCALWGTGIWPESAVQPDELFYSNVRVIADSAMVGDTLTLDFTLVATGTAPSLISHIAQSDSVTFFNMVGTFPDGVTWEPDSEETIPVKDSAIISIRFVVPNVQTGVFIDTVVAYDGDGDTIKNALTAVVLVNPSASVSIPTASPLYQVIAEEGSLKIIAAPNIVSTFPFELYDVSGVRVIYSLCHSGSVVDVSSISRGVYFWHIGSGAQIQSGKVVLGQ